MQITIICKKVKEEYSIGGNKSVTLTLTKKQYSDLIQDNYKRAMKKLETGKY